MSLDDLIQAKKKQAQKKPVQVKKRPKFKLSLFPRSVGVVHSGPADPYSCKPCIFGIEGFIELPLGP